MPSARLTKWLKANKESFGSSDGYPGEFHRQQLWGMVVPQCRVAIIDSRNQVHEGKVMIKSASHASFLIDGSSGARPGMVDARNIIWCSNAPARIMRESQLGRKA